MLKTLQFPRPLYFKTHNSSWDLISYNCSFTSDGLQMMVWVKCKHRHAFEFMRLVFRVENERIWANFHFAASRMFEFQYWLQYYWYNRVQ